MDRAAEPDSYAELVATFAAARARALSTIAEACARAHRDSAEITLLAVSKTVPSERLRAAVEAGLTILGENRVQEAETKAPQLPGASWHLIGPLQSNKARKAVELFDVIESVDSVELARRLDRLADELDRSPYSVYLQINVDNDEAKAGLDPARLESELAEIGELPNLRLLGLMTVGRQVPTAEEARPTFVRLRELSARLRSRVGALGSGLSMGMTADYPIAIEEGATIVRVGRDLFGERPLRQPGR